MQCIGMDLGTRNTAVAMLTEAGELEAEAVVRTTRAAMKRFFEGQQPTRIVMEATGCSPWLSREMETLGHDVIVLNPRRARLIAESTLKTDRLDAEVLARLGRLSMLEPNLLARVQHRSESTQKLRTQFRTRAELVTSRTRLVNCARGMARSLGHPLPSTTTLRFPERVRASGKVPQEIQQLLEPLLATIEHLSESISSLTEKLDLLSKDFPAVQQLQSVPGVGLLTAFYFVLCIEEPGRFKHGRDVGSYLGLRPKLRESGERSLRGGISRSGDPEMRRLLTQAAHAFMRSKRPDCLKDWAERLMQRSNRKVATTALARKLAVLMHSLWMSGTSYDSERARPQE